MAANRNEHPLVDHTALSSLRFGEFPAFLVRACHSWKLGARRRERMRPAIADVIVFSSQCRNEKTIPTIPPLQPRQLLLLEFCWSCRWSCVAVAAAGAAGAAAGAV